MNWTDDFKNQVNLQVRDDGIFWMPYENFLKFYRSMSVAIYEDFKHEVLQEHAKPGYFYYSITNPVDQRVYVTAEVFSERMFPRGECNPKNNLVL